MRTAKWWSSSASDRRVAGALLAIALPLALVACRGDDRASSAVDVPAAADDTPSGSLPAPEAAPGTSVTGMPTAPPPPRGVAPDTVATAPAATDTPAAPPEGDATATPPVAAVRDDATGPSPAPPPPAPGDATAAANLVSEYMAALASGAFARAQALWSTTPNDSAVLQLARNTPFDIAVGGASADAGGRINVPVDVRGKADDGSDRHVLATYTVQRGPTGTWRIMAANVRDAER